MVLQSKRFHRAVSIIVCTHNRSSFLCNVLSQLCTQEYPAELIEILVVDNNSTDNTRQVVEDFALNADIPIRYIFEPRSGVTFTRNRGALEAKHPFLAYLDDDCTVESSWLAHLLGAFDLHEAVVAVGGHVIPDWGQEEKPNWIIPELLPWFAATKEFFSDSARLLKNSERIVEGNMAIQKEVIINYGGFVGMEQFGSRSMAASEVLILLEKIRRHDRRIAFSPKAVAYHYSDKQLRSILMRRVYWQGVSDALLDTLIEKKQFLRSIFQTGNKLFAIIFLLLLTAGSYMTGSFHKGFYHLTRVIWRIGFILCKTHLVGDWTKIRLLKSEHLNGQTYL